MKGKIGLLTDTQPLDLMIKNILSSETLSVQVFNSVKISSPQDLAEKNLDILFLKTSLKNINGLEFCSSIREISELSKLKIIFLSTDRDIAEKAITYRADYFINIPFQPHNIRETLSKAMKRSPRVLYVDDSQIFHQKNVPELIKSGLDVFEAFDGKEAWEFLQDNDVDLVVTDVEMPNMNGFELCEAIKTSETLMKLPVIITTTLDNEESVQKGFKAGVNEYLTKPFLISELISRIDRYTSQKQAIRVDKILVIDDSEMIRKSIDQALRGNGFVPDLARNGRVALSKLRNQNYHLIITDYEMAPIDGYQLTLQIRSDPKLQDIPIIMISSHVMQSDEVRVRSAGIQAYIGKPFKSDRLLVEVERLLAEFRLKRERAAMRHYMTDEALENIVNSLDSGSRITLPAEDSFRTVLFTDIEKFTPLCENMSSHEVVNLLNNYFDVMVEILIDNGAAIDKFIGDAIMAIFADRETGALKAVHSGLTMIQNLDRVRKTSGVDVHMRIGINSGHVIIGDIGSELYRRDFTVIGDNVNTAQRLESNAGRDGVLISDSTYDLVKDFVVAEKRELTLKGKRDKFLAWQVSDLNKKGKQKIPQAVAKAASTS
jgi:CheY-like chemotaxis protein